MTMIILSILTIKNSENQSDFCIAYMVFIKKVSKQLFESTKIYMISDRERPMDNVLELL